VSFHLKEEFDALPAQAQEVLAYWFGDQPAATASDLETRLNRWFGDAQVAISAKTGAGVEELLSEISTQIRPERELLQLRIPHEAAAAIARLHKVGQVLERRYLAKSAKFKARIPPHHHAEFAAFIVE
jgi:50S ribosomal subunit-associated GTPase HflX